MVTIRMKGVRPAWAGLAVLLLSGGVLWSGCGSSSPDHGEELKLLLDSARYEDLLAQVKVYRGQGDRGPSLDYAEGVALLHQNADRMAVPLLQRAVLADSSLAADASSALSTRAWEDFEQGWKDRAARRMKHAYLFDPAIELGELKDMVGDLFFRYDEDFENAHDVYRQLYRERNGPEAKVQEWVYRYGFCLERIDSREAARAVYEEFRNTWPQDRNILRFVNWRYMKLLMDYGNEARERGQNDEALEWYQKALEPGWHMDLRQEIRFLMGDLEQNRGNLEAARDYYERVVADGSESGGDAVENARRGLDEIHAMGVH